MSSSTLSIHLLKGPKEGEILTRKPGTQIRIGRVVKGNNFTIKDPAISQKHISIKFDPVIARWVLEDLDTSNGTILNDVKIDSLVQTPLSDGDIIKIGDTTSISVKIEMDCELVNYNLRRGRSRAKINSKDLKKDENLEERVDESEGMIPRRAGLRSRGGSKLNENLVYVVDDKKALHKNAQRGRPKKKHGHTMVSLEINEEKEGVYERMEEEEIQSLEGERNETMESTVEDNMDKNKNEKVGRKRNAQNTRQASAKILKCMNGENFGACANTEEKEGSLKEIVETLVVDYTEGKESVQEKENAKEKENVKEKENAKEKENDEEETEKDINFEKMTLGEWFDSLEKYLPLAINEAAEARVAELREQARRFEEYIGELP